MHFPLHVPKRWIGRSPRESEANDYSESHQTTQGGDSSLQMRGPTCSPQPVLCEVLITSASLCLQIPRTGIPKPKSGIAFLSFSHSLHDTLLDTLHDTLHHACMQKTLIAAEMVTLIGAAAVVVTLSTLCSCAVASTGATALTPPLGWNSWNKFGSR